MSSASSSYLPKRSDERNVPRSEAANRSVWSGSGQFVMVYAINNLQYQSTYHLFKWLMDHSDIHKGQFAEDNQRMVIGLTQSAFYVNLYRAVIGPSGQLTGRWRPDVDLRRMLAGKLVWYITVKVASLFCAQHGKRALMPCENSKDAFTKSDQSICCITKTCLCNVDSLKPHFYIVKLGFIGV